MQNIWNLNFDWILSGNTWSKKDRSEFIDNLSIQKTDDIYFKYQKCISGVTYQYVLSLNDVYDRNIMTGDFYYSEFYYNQHDIINNFMKNYNYVDFYIENNFNLNDKITKINNNFLKSNHKLILINQDNKIENGIYSFDINGKIIKTNDLDTNDKSYRFGVHVKMDNNNNINLFLENDNFNFPTTNEEKDFIPGNPIIIKHIFDYNIKNTGITFQEIPKIWFTDYDFARKLNDENYSLYNELNINGISNNILIKYRNYNPIVFKRDLSLPSEYNDILEWSQFSDLLNITGYTVFKLNDNDFIENCSINDYLKIELNGDYNAFFNASVKLTGVSELMLNEYIPDYILSGMTNIYIKNLNRFSTLSNLNELNEHFIGQFFDFTTGNTVKIINHDYKYIDYDSFKLVFNPDTIFEKNFNFDTNNWYINYKLYEHLSGISYDIFNEDFDLGSGYTMSNFISMPTYLINDSSYPQQISDLDSPLKIIPDDLNDLNYFYKYAAVYIDNDFNHKVFILEKDHESIIIERPNYLNFTSITSFYTLTGISEVLYDIYLNYDKFELYYKKDNEFISKICKTYNDLLSIDSRIIEKTTGTITQLQNNNYILKLFNYRNFYNTLISGNTINDIYYENDNNLTFKPTDIIEIGIDKQTKMPLIIKDDEIIIYDDENEYKINIVKKDFSQNIILVDGLTIEDLKIKYIWILNATIENAIIGENDYGLVWYKGDWMCGEWVNGTWYSGTWHSGIWKNGKWYSYLIDEFSILSENIFKILDINKRYSQFLKGQWVDGEWFDGIFGDNISITGYTSKVFLNHVNILPSNLDVSIWKNGKFHLGDFKNSIWENGIFFNGNMFGGYWKNGNFLNGEFKGNWWNGNFYGGVFISGIWENGLATSSNNIIKFGYHNYENSATTMEWWNGYMNNCEVYPGLYEPVNYNRTHIYSGTFYNVKIFGGHFFTGDFIESNFYNGIFGIDSNNNFHLEILNENGNILPNFNNSNFINGLWLNGHFKSGNFYNGLWFNGYFESGNIINN